MLNSPSIPAGRVLGRELKALAEVLERHPGVWTISDDMYEHVLFDGAVRRRRGGAAAGRPHRHGERLPWPTR
jgi:aspartate/methionine/tyrosine aminotransferase